MREARERLHDVAERVEQETIGFYEVALIHSELGGLDEAFNWLEGAYRRRDKGLVYLKVDPPLDPLRSDSRFQDLLRRMNFPG